jgi:NADPH-dependent 2,4-dienoyl-CoA reductase/sulfur reductase-like enzyme
MDDGMVIVGGGLAAQRCAEALRRRGYDGRLRMVCGEPHRPYDRPPLSKGLLAGESGEDDLALRPEWWYAETQVELLLGARARELDPRARRLRLEGGRELAYASLLVATGGEPCRLPFLERYSNVHYLRSRADASRLRSELRGGARLAVVGGGFIGQEVAATARRLGVQVTMLEALPALLATILGERLGGWFANLHREEGVEVLTGSGLAAARGSTRAEELLLEDGRCVECDVVVVGIGTRPATRWLAKSGLGGDGVRTDTAGRTAVPGVFAAGDAALAFDPRYGEYARTEHWDAAAWQGAAVGQAVLGAYPGTPPLPSFWSDQYGLRIRCVGHPQRGDAVIVDGDPRGRDFEAVFTRSGKPVAGLAVGRPRAIPALRRRIDSERWPGREWNEEAA